MSAAELRHILFLQRRDILRMQGDEAARFFAEHLPEACVQFASSPQEIASPGSVDIIVTPVLPWLPDVLACAPRVRWVHFLSAGVDGIWTMRVNWARYLLSKSTGVNDDAMSEFALATILYFVKRLETFREQQSRKEWKRCWLEELQEKTLGILGLGTVGRALARKATAFGMRVIGTAASPREMDSVEEVFPPSGLSSVLIQANFVVVLLPLTEETRGLVDDRAIAQMKRGSYLVQLSRGGIVDEGALVRALETGQLAAAAVDVFQEEPLPPDSPLWGAPNLLVTPHVAGTTQRYQQRALELFMNNLRCICDTGVPSTPVVIRRGY